MSYSDDDDDKWPVEGCESAFDLGWLHGTEDVGQSGKFRPGISLTEDEFEDYKAGYREARKNW